MFGSYSDGLQPSRLLLGSMVDSFLDIEDRLQICVELSTVAAADTTLEIVLLFENIRWEALRAKPAGQGDSQIISTIYLVLQIA